MGTYLPNPGGQQQRQRGICQPELHDMEPCPKCGTFIEAGAYCDHHNLGVVAALAPPDDND